MIDVPKREAEYRSCLVASNVGWIRNEDRTVISLGIKSIQVEQSSWDSNEQMHMTVKYYMIYSRY